ncbi:MAG: hypothetical protein ACLQVM_02730 [Terriglobia bacterium]
MSEQNPEIKATTGVEDVDLTRGEQPEKQPTTPLERILQSLRKAQPASNPPASGSRKDLGKDKSKTLYVSVAVGIAVILFLLIYLSSPQKPNQGQAPAHRGNPDLGQRTTPGQAQKQAGSTVPLLTADMRDQQSERNGEVTPEDINRMSHANSQSLIEKPNATANTLVPPEEATGKTSGAKNPSRQQYVLGRIDFSDPELQQKYANAGQGPDLSPETVPPRLLASSNTETDLKKPSLVFVSSESTTIPNVAGSLAGRDNGIVNTALGSEGISLNSMLPAGTRLVARLESPATTAVSTPVVAAIEYNYEQEGEIIVPAGSKALGKMEQANSSGYVALRFDRIEFPDGATGKMDGTAMGLDFAPVKGLVSGKRRGAGFLVQTLTGMGTIAAYLVGGNNLSGPISDSALLRERLADNVAIAGQNEMNGVAFNQNIMVTVPGNTRFYIVVEQTAISSGQAPTARRASSASGIASDGQAVPNLQELRQLLQLRQELSQLYPQEPSEKTAPDDNPQQ